MGNLSVTVRVPATSANCGPGYDCVGLACSMYDDFTFTLQEVEKGVTLDVAGEGRGELMPGKECLAAVAFERLWQQLKCPPVGLHIRMHNAIPLCRGLGSSSAAIVGGLMAANTLGSGALSRDGLLTIATEIEGHPDNVAPAIMGGITVSAMAEGKVCCLNFMPRAAFQLVAVIPKMHLPTVLARKVVPQVVPLTDAVHNVSRAALFISSLLTGRLDLLPQALEDKLHQPYRAHLIPGFNAALSAARRLGAYGAVLSGAGSTLMAYVPLDVSVTAVGEEMVRSLAAAGTEARYELVSLDSAGARVL